MLSPVLVFTGVFGLPEMIYSTLILLSLVEFGRWVQDRTVASVITSGVALGLAFLLRYNVLLLAVVMAWGYWYVAREEEHDTGELEGAQANMLAFLVPIVFVTGLWTLIAWFPRGYITEYITLAREVTALGNDDPAVIARMADLRGNPLSVGPWVGGWTLAIGPASVIATLALAAFAVQAQRRAEGVLAILCAAVLLPELVALLSGWGQAHVPHLFVVVVPGFAIMAYRERLLTRGVPPTGLEGPRRRAQIAFAGGLFLASMASAGALWLMPDTDPPAGALETTIRTGLAPAPATLDELEMAAYIRANAGAGDVVADLNRHAALILLVDDPSVFQTRASEADEATLYEPSGAARWILVRQAVAGQGAGRIERAYDNFFNDGAEGFHLDFERGPYRLYAVTEPALP